MIKTPQRYKRYLSIEKLMASLLLIPKNEDVGEYSVGYDGGELNSKEWVKTLELQKVWGFVDDKNTVHFWMDEKCPFETLLSFIAHETGHLNGRQYKDLTKEETKAREFDQVAVYAYKRAMKILKQNCQDSSVGRTQNS